MTAGKHHLDAATKYARTARLPHIRPPLTVNAWYRWKRRNDNAAPPRGRKQMNDAGEGEKSCKKKKKFENSTTKKSQKKTNVKYM